MKKLIDSTEKDTIFKKYDMYSFYFENPKQSIEREFNNTKLKYCYFNSKLKLRTETLKFCLDEYKV